MADRQQQAPVSEECFLFFSHCLASPLPLRERDQMPLWCLALKGGNLLLEIYANDSGQLIRQQMLVGGGKDQNTVCIIYLL